MKTCPFCAEEIQDAAIVCKHCGRELTVVVPSTPAKPAAKETNWVLIVLLFIGVVVVIGRLGSWAQSRQAPASTQSAFVPARSVASTKMYDDYEANEVRADQEYRGTNLVTGRAKDIGKDITGVPYVMLGQNLENPWGVQAMFDEDETGLSSLTKGQAVTVLCRQNQGLVVTNVILRRCSLQ